VVGELVGLSLVREATMELVASADPSEKRDGGGWLDSG